MKSVFLALFFGIFSFALNAQSISFKLKNTAPKSIALEIPGVMNPNLSPFSYSGVELKKGQKIYFNYRGNRYLLLEVDETLEDKKLVINKLIKQRKRELKL